MNKLQIKLEMDTIVDLLKGGLVLVSFKNEEYQVSIEINKEHLPEDEEDVIEIIEGLWD